MEEKYILKLDNVFYNGLYHGKVSISDYNNCIRFSTKKELLKDIKLYDWVSDELKENYSTINILNILE